MKPLVLAIALALVAPLPSLAQTAAKPAAQTPAPAPAWVTKSNEHAHILLNAQAPFQPETLSFFGVPGYDDQVTDLGPNNSPRFREAVAKASATLQTSLATERDANVRQDLEIMIAAAAQSIEGSELNERLMLPWTVAAS